jgi:hypothetical protein
MIKPERIKKEGDALFSRRGNLLSLWQEIAENFYPERADFTGRREIGDDYAGNLDTSYPLLARRDLGNQIGGILRPTQKDWFSIKKKYDEDLDNDAKKWLEWAAKIQKRAMYDPVSMFTRATKEADHDWASFGQAVISLRMNLRDNALLYRTYHLRDVAWKEDFTGRIGTVYRKWCPDVLTLNSIFKENVHPKVKEWLTKDPYKEVNVYHCEIPVETCDNMEEYKEFPTVSVYYDCDNNHVMEETGIYEGEYIIPRWQTVSGSQYAFSPATVAALPDARLLQSIARLLLDASEKAIDPPMVAVQEAIRGDISLWAGGVTYTSSDYDERLGEVLRQLKTSDKLPIGFEMNEDVRHMISEAFYLNKLGLEPPTPNMTAYEYSERVAEHIRQVLPIFEPTESEYNAPLCEKTFNKLMQYGAFGSSDNIPESLHGGDITFQFESPMRDSLDRMKGQKFIESSELIKGAMELDPSSGYVVDAVEALRDALEGIGSPAKWRRSKQEVQAILAEQQDMQESAQALQEAQQGADVAKTLNQAGGM